MKRGNQLTEPNLTESNEIIRMIDINHRMNNQRGNQTNRSNQNIQNSNRNDQHNIRNENSPHNRNNISNVNNLNTKSEFYIDSIF